MAVWPASGYGPRRSSPSSASLPGAPSAGITALVVLGIAAFAVLSAGGPGGTGFTADNEGLVQPGQQAPSFAAETVNGGGEVAVGDGGRGATLLVFFATWCPHCQNEAPIIADLEEEYGERLRVVMAGMDGTQGDTPEDVRGFVERYGIEGPAVYQPPLGERYGVSVYPTVYVLDGEGRVVAAHGGEAPEDALRSWVEEAL